jgi:TolB-like protein
MKHAFATSILFLFIVTVSFSQEKTGVGILPFSYVQGSADFQDVNSIQETVTNSFVKTKRFNIVDRSKMDALRAEKNLQKTEEFIDGKVIQQGVSLGANYLISGHVISAQAERMVSSEGVISYRAQLSISLKIIDVATGQVSHSETIQPKGGSMLGGMLGTGPSTPQAAISKAIQGIQDKIDDFVSENFPVNFPIVEIQEKDSKGAATKVMIAGGSSFGLKKGDRLKVVEVLLVDVAGKKLERKKEIGEIKISKVEDENFSICSVGEGGTEINTKFESKAKLIVITKN